MSGVWMDPELVQAEIGRLMKRVREGEQMRQDQMRAQAEAPEAAHVILDRCMSTTMTIESILAGSGEVKESADHPRRPLSIEGMAEYYNDMLRELLGHLRGIQDTIERNLDRM